jgi:hypothetical protein
LIVFGYSPDFAKRPEPPQQASGILLTVSPEANLKISSIPKASVWMPLRFSTALLRHKRRGFGQVVALRFEYNQEGPCTSLAGRTPEKSLRDIPGEIRFMKERWAWHSKAGERNKWWSREPQRF